VRGIAIGNPRSDESTNKRVTSARRIDDVAQNGGILLRIMTALD